VTIEFWPEAPSYPNHPRPSADLVTAWVEAWRHYWAIHDLMTDATAELTTGHTPFCPVSWGEWCDGASGCPPLHDDRPSPPCTCRYGLHPTIWCPTHLIDVPGVGQRGAAYTFRIDPWCPHHAPVRVGGWDAFSERRS
jgi:hypothetical protein